MPPKVSVIIVNYNAGTYLNRCLEALLAQDFQDFEILLVDNGSTDDSLDYLPQSEKLMVIPLLENLGFAAANNIAAYEAKGEWLALLNPDAFPEKNWLTALVNAAETHPQFCMFGSTQICADEPNLLDGSGDIYHIIGVPRRGNFRRPLEELPETGEVFSPCAAAALYRKDIFLEAGGFDERFFCYCEDVDLAFRLRLMGGRCLQVKEAVVHHVGSGITGKSTFFPRYYGIRNRFLVFIKNMPMPLLLLLLPFHATFQSLCGVSALLNGEFRIFYNAWKDIFRHLPSIWQARQNVQRTRTLDLFSLLRAFTFSPFKLIFRQEDTRPLKG